ncbi:MAG: MltA domain-containing protein [Deltaproteobacteria bacterium]|nr:MltA domain-containing protein [Deltaproteobacteria bacterium]
MEKKIREHFTFWRVKMEEKSSAILLTGYYEPLIEGNFQPGGEYRYPLYRRPEDLIELESPGGKRVVRMESGQPLPYYSRREIDGLQVLQGKGYELLWLKDPWERYVLHVQGSGQIRLPDRQMIRVGFAGSNGRPYRSIGRVLRERGFLSENEPCRPMNVTFFSASLPKRRGLPEPWGSHSRRAVPLLRT